MIPLDPSPEPEPVMQGTVSSSVRERPILFSGEMVRAILDGRKSQTRRVVKFPQRLLHSESPTVYLGETAGQHVFRAAGRWGGQLDCPYGAVGDRLWVRETFFINHVDGLSGPLPKVPPSDVTRELLLNYRADGEFHQQFEEVDGTPEWRPSIHMPRWASRLTLEITDVRVERVQEISEVDAIAEGVASEPNPDWKAGDDPWTSARLAVDVYRELWDSLNAKRGYGWDVNCWVWVLSFRSA